jgi:prepilin-type N-terminal cleavage/methylation domain-containing protein
MALYRDTKEDFCMHKTHSQNADASSVSRKPAGFTLIEMLIAIAIIAILTAISYPIYTSSIDKAKITKGISTLETVRKAFEDYHINYGSYPPALDIATGQDGTGRIVLTPQLLDEFNSNLSSFEGYALATDDFTLTARAIDSKHTHLVLKSGSVVTLGP